MSEALSGDLDARFRAGQVAARLVAPGVTMGRRVERIRWIGAHRFERRMSLDIDQTRADSVAERLGLRLDLYFVGLLPKQLLPDFDLRDAQGSALVVAGRGLDSRFGQALLIALAARHMDDFEMPTSRVWERIFVSVHRFPGPTPPVSTEPLRRWARALAFEDLSSRGVMPLSDADTVWWARACDSSDWVWWLRRLVLNFPVLGHRPPDGPVRTLLKTRWEDNNPEANHGPRSEASLAAARSGLGYLVPVYDLGRAASEHVHLLAAPETFFTGGVVLRNVGRRHDVKVRSRSSLTQHSFYLAHEPRRPGRRGGPRPWVGLASLQVRVWPNPRAFVLALRLIGLYSLLLMGIITAMQLFNLPARLSSNLDAVAALVFFLPSIIFPILLHRDENEVRWVLLTGWRNVAFRVFAPLPLNFALFMAVPSTEVGRWILFACFLATTLYLAWAVSALYADTDVIRFAHRRASELERGPSKGLWLSRRS